MKNAETLSHVFSRIIREWLTPDELKDVNEANKGEGYVDEYCATHEYIDPNQAMVDAFKEVYERDANISIGSSDITLINEAWALAKKSGFMIGANVEYIEPKEDEKGLTFTVHACDAAKGLGIDSG